MATGGNPRRSGRAVRRVRNRVDRNDADRFRRRVSRRCDRADSARRVRACRGGDRKRVSRRSRRRERRRVVRVRDARDRRRERRKTRRVGKRLVSNRRALRLRRLSANAKTEGGNQGSGNFFATVAASWTQNGARNAEISITYYDRTAGATVAAVALSPLSRENDLFAEGTQILVVKTVEGAIYLLNAECPQ